MNAGRSLLSLFAVLSLSAAFASAAHTPVRIEQTVEAQFPASLALSTITSGEARVTINVDSEGRLIDWMVTGYTHKAFADETVYLLKQWRYSPAKVDGEPVSVRLDLQMYFTSTGRVISVTTMDTPDVLIRRSQQAALQKRVCTPKQLDRPLEALQTVHPPHPGKAENAVHQTGSTMIDFYIDEEGRIRMPVVTETTDQAYALAAVGALSQWRFSAPTSGGKPTAVRVKQQFVFPSGGTS